MAFPLEAPRLQPCSQWTTVLEEGDNRPDAALLPQAPEVEDEVDAPALFTPFFDYGFGFDDSILLLLKQKIPNATLEKQWLNVAADRLPTDLK